MTITAEGDSIQPRYPWREISLRVSGGKFMSANRRLESFRRDLLTSNGVVFGQYYRCSGGSCDHHFCPRRLSSVLAP